MADRVDVDRSAMAALLRSDDVRRDLEQRGERIRRAAGPGHGLSSGSGRSRVRVSVFTETFEARRAEAINHQLTRAIDAGR